MGRASWGETVTEAGPSWGWDSSGHRASSLGDSEGLQPPPWVSPVLSSSLSLTAAPSLAVLLSFSDCLCLYRVSQSLRPRPLAWASRARVCVFTCVCTSWACM